MMISIKDLAYYTADYMNVAKGLYDFAFPIYNLSQMCSLTPAMPEALMPCHVMVFHAFPNAAVPRSSMGNPR